MADKQMLPKNFQVYVGIDFGTDGTGLAYALPDGKVFIHQKWKVRISMHFIADF